MAHFAKIDNNNVVQEVLVFDISDNTLPLMPLPEGWKWVRTSYNSNIRKRFAGIGYTYDEDNDIFIQPKPYNSWILDTQNYEWKPPIDNPGTSYTHRWDEETTSWIEIIYQNN